MLDKKYKGFGNLYVRMLQLDLEEELQQHPEILKELSGYTNRFINWCAVQRVTFEHDLYDEVHEFKEKYIHSRLSFTDYKLWKEISAIVFKRDHYTCAYCGKTGGLLEPDHIVPICKGGTNNLENLTTACRKCNRQKKDKSVEEFMEWRKVRE